MKSLSDDEGSVVLLVAGAILGLAVVFEVVILGIAFFGADRVECNLLWCTFTTERSSGVHSIEQQVISSRECSVNGQAVECSRFDAEFPHYRAHGWDSVAGICPGLDDNRTFLDCVEEYKRGVE